MKRGCKGLTTVKKDETEGLLCKEMAPKFRRGGRE